MSGVVRTAECVLAHLSSHSSAETCGARWTVKLSTLFFWRKETFATTLTPLLKVKVKLPLCLHEHHINIYGEGDVQMHSFLTR
jgi:hypothetical protein